MSKTTSSQKDSKQKIKKYIVEVPEPTNDQVPSSGGLRGKNGKLAVQYKNPREYKEPIYPPVQSSQADIAREQFNRTAAEFGTEIFWTANDNFIQPLARYLFQRAAFHIIGFFDDLTATPRYQQIIDEENKHKENETDLDEDDADDDSKITKFPGRRVS